ncbi:MAG: endonuclease/exonuclease/phosphatase family protein [Chloroflexota bacterium]|nr:endonuclease/exonuclease/phosphatase family protein [Dehalococcoidia bacterium]MDW8254258.1 endonuclease/exonuclease/phosphatase family protein [Chloroflexota bacterium]
MGLPLGVTVAAATRLPAVRRLVDRVTVATVASLVGVTAFASVQPSPAGPLAVALIFLPHLFIPLLVLVPLALALGGRVAKAAAAVGGLLWAFLFLPGLLALPASPTPGALRFSVATWNLLEENTDAAALRRTVAEADASVVALQELSFRQRDLLLADPVLADRYRSRALFPNDRYRGMGLLSVFPILEEGYREAPPVMWARLDAGGRRLLIVNAHPLPGQIAWLRFGTQALPVGFDGTTRDEQIAAILSLTQTLRRPDEPVLLVGDFNVTEREPAYRRITAQFGDAKRAAGFGAQNTWKSWFLMRTGWAILRIDYLFFSADFTVTAVATDCRQSGSDHCLVRAVFQLPPSGLP